ncbi:hypothetical protein GUITHDRAFT_117240 [Guillardia theta CCMP2712]|uniref:LRRK2 ARM repeat domain-containing protein n=1 Tax=Guillardia theta (strain CCMP2712) TaxID=905079 RepID=L1ILB0_GUITC|nr:hypothetical protein GUITHDRAFT_117240 [Guillardia theta CCMP2712]EKX36585.1 hypothetical protein GUITHDRAFT_117240 [Guillardia theta CCMP2712]|eukprot:XP_005823565.1 hypothetical protein GUITHDRAFT_117240 [Guillardia theta CCMP2712]
MSLAEPLCLHVQEPIDNSERPRKKIRGRDRSGNDYRELPAHEDTDKGGRGSAEVEAALHDLYRNVPRSMRLLFGSRVAVNGIVPDTMMRDTLAAMAEYRDKRIQQAGLRILGKISWEDETVKMFRSKAGFEAVIMAIREHEQDNWLQEAGFEVVRGLLDHAMNHCRHSYGDENKIEMRREIRAAGCVDAAIGAMRKHAANLSLQETALVVLAGVMQDDEGRREVLAAGGEKAVLDAMRTCKTDAPVLHAALEVLVMISQVQQGRREVLAAGGEKAVLEAMQEHKDDEEVRTTGLKVIRSLLEEEEGRRAMLAAGVVELVKSTLKFRENSCARDQALAVLSCLATDKVHGPNKSVEAVTGAMRGHQEDLSVQRAGMESLMTMSSMQGLDAVFAAMHHHIQDEWIQEAGLELVCDLLYHATLTIKMWDRHGYDDENEAIEMRREIRAAGCVDAAIGAMRKHAANLSLQETALVVLAGVMQDDEGRREVLAAGGEKAVLDAMRTCKTDAPVLHAALEVLVMISQVQQGRREVLAAGGEKAVLEAMQEHKDDEEVRTTGLKVIRSLLEEEEGRRAMLAAGVVELVKSTLKFRENSCARDQALAVLSCLATDKVHGPNKSVEAVTGAMRGHQEDLSVQRAGMESLMTMSSMQGLDAVFAAMHHHIQDEWIQEAGLELVCDLLYHATLTIKMWDRHGYDDENEAIEMRREIRAAGCVDAAIGAMRKHAANLSLQETALVVLAGVMQDDEGRREVLAAGGEKAVLDAMRTCKTDAPVLHAALEVLVMISQVQQGRREVLAAGGEKTVLEAMQEHKDDEEVRTTGLKVIRSLLEEEGGRRAMLAAGVVELVKSILGSAWEDLSVQEAGMECTESSKERELLKRDGPEAVVLEFRKNTSVCNGLIFLKSHIMKGQEELLELLEAGVVEAIVDAMNGLSNTWDCGDLFDRGMELLGQISHEEKGRYKIRAAGGIQTILSICSNESINWSLKTKGLEVLLTISENEDGCKEIRAAGGLTKILLFLDDVRPSDHRWRRMFEWGEIRIIFTLIGSLTSEGKYDHNNAEIVALVCAMREDKNDDVCQRVGIVVIESLLLDLDCKEAFLAAGGEKVVLDAMRTCKTDAPVLHAALEVLVMISQVQQGRREVLAAGGEKTVLEAMQEHKDDEEVRTTGLKVIRSLLEEEGGRRAMLAAGVVKVLLSFLSHKQKYVGVDEKTELLMLLGFIAIYQRSQSEAHFKFTNKYSLKTIESVVKLEAIIAAMIEHKEHVQVQASGFEQIQMVLKEIDGGGMEFITCGAFELLMAAMRKSEESSELKRACLTTLSWLTSEGQARREVRKAGCIKATSHIILECATKQLWDLGLQVLANLWLDDEARSEILSCKVLKMLVKEMVTYGSLCRPGFTLIKQILWDKDGWKKFLAAGGAKAIVVAMEMFDFPLELLRIEEMARAFKAAGGVNSVLSALTCDSKKNHMDMFKVLSCLATKNDGAEADMQDIGDEQIVASVMQEHGADANVQESGLTLFHGMLGTSSKWEKKPERAVILKSAVAATCKHPGRLERDPGSRRVECSDDSYAGYGSGGANRRRGGQESLYVLSTRILQDQISNDTENRRLSQGLETLGIFANSKEGSRDVWAAEGVQCALAAMFKFIYNREVQSQSLSLLLNLLQEECQVCDFIAMGGVKALLTAMRTCRPQSNSHAMESWVKLLRQVSQVKEGRREIRAAEGVKQIVHVIQTCEHLPWVGSIQKAGMRILGNIGKDEEGRSEIIAAGEILDSDDFLSSCGSMQSLKLERTPKDELAELKSLRKNRKPRRWKFARCARSFDH